MNREKDCIACGCRGCLMLGGPVVRADEARSSALIGQPEVARRSGPTCRPSTNWARGAEGRRGRCPRWRNC